MTEKKLKNIAASVRQRLLNKSRSDIRPFQEIVQYYAMERFLYLLSKSLHANRFVLKGALMLRIWQAPEIRPTMDINRLKRTDNDISKLIPTIAEILSVDIGPDGLSFLPMQEHAPANFEDSVMQVKSVILPIASALASQTRPPSQWSAPGPWVY